MPNIYYKIQYKTELEALNLELKKSKCKGLLIPKKHFFQINKEDGCRKIDETYLKTLKSFNKKIILYENYHTKRPSLLDPEKLKDDKSKKDFKHKIEKFKSKCNETDLENFLKGELNDYQEIYSFYNHYISQEPTSIVERKLYKDGLNFEISQFTIPYIPITPSKSFGSTKFFNDLAQYTNRTNIILNKLIDKHFNIFNLENHLLTITLILDDYKKNPSSINNVIKNCAKFKSIGLWIIDFNEIDTKATKENINYYKEIISKFDELHSSLFIYYSGVYSSRLIEKINPEINNILRIDGYPGLNVNIEALVSRTRRFYYQGNGNFYNARSFAEKLLTNHSKEKYDCNCLICLTYRIKDFEKAFNFFIKNPKNNVVYKEFIGQAKKTKEKKLKAKQRIFLMRHNFHNLDHHLHLDYEEFKRLIFSTNFIMNNWKKSI